jgi:ribosomal protein L11 methyltransferase
MSNYCELTIDVTNETLREVLIAELSEVGYEGFEESANGLKAYITEEAFLSVDVNGLINKHGLSYSSRIIEKQNWNAVWESNFEPVQVDDFVGVRASFHPSFVNVEHEIVITPKMSFGTGHHATTYMVMQLMREVDFINKSVFDFGTGTGILAILAEKLGADKIIAVDNDDWCIENASENILVNNCNKIDIQIVNTLLLNQQFDIILANINRNIILDNIHQLRKALVTGGQLILSGLLNEDEPEIINVCLGLGLEYKKTINRAGWIALWFS